MINYQDKWTLVTGASSGIGKAFAERLAAAGTKLILVARNETTLKSLASELKQKYQTESIILVKDLSKPNAPQEIVDAVKNEGISLDILINNAGFGTYGHLHTMDLNRDHELLTVNIFALTDLTHLFMKDMVEKKSGVVINISSIAAFVPIKNFAVYSASKAYVRHFSEILWSEYKDQGIKVLCVCPGSTDTNFFKVAHMKPSQPNPASPYHVVDQSLKALKKNQIYVVCGPYKNKLFVQVIRFFSRKFLTKLLALH